MAQVELVSHTTPVAPNIPDMESVLVYIARVSNPKNQNNHATAPKLIKYLIDHKHWSPFEMVDITFEIVTSRAISHQLIRHRSFSFQEFSQRYSSVTALEPVELRHQAEVNRQSSTTPVNSPELDRLVKSSLETSKQAYEQLLAAGVARETARFVLPLTTQTRLYMKGSLRSWIHFLAVRDDSHAQKEIQILAKAIKVELKKLYPNVAIALDW